MAAIYFAALGPVEWAEGFVMAVGAVAGGYYGAGLARRLGRTFVRRVVMVIGLAIVASMLLRG